MNRKWILAVVTCLFIMSFTVAWESMAEKPMAEEKAPEVKVESAADGSASALLGMDRASIFTAAQAALANQGRLLGAWPDSGRMEGVIEATSVVISLIPIDSQVTRMLVEAAPLAGSGDVSSIAAGLLQSTLTRLTGMPAVEVPNIEMP